MMMANSRLIYFSDEAFERLESMVIFDGKGKPLSRARKINYLILDKLTVTNVDNISSSDMLKDLRNIRSGIISIDSMIMMEKYDRAAEIANSLGKYVIELMERIK